MSTATAFTVCQRLLVQYKLLCKTPRTTYLSIVFILVCLSIALSWRMQYAFFYKDLNQLSLLARNPMHCIVQITRQPPLRRLKKLHARIVQCNDSWKPQSPSYITLYLRAKTLDLGSVLHVSLSPKILYDPLLYYYGHPSQALAQRIFSKSLLLQRQQWFKLSTTPSQTDSLLERWRWRLMQHFLQSSRPFHHQPSFGIIFALLFGDTTLITRQHWDILKTSGIVHLIAISGLHFQCLETALSGLLRQPFAYLHPVFPALYAALLALPVLAGYAVISGFSPSTQRAFSMQALRCLRLCLWKKPNAWIDVTVAAGTHLLLDPLCLHHKGFQLSYTLVVCLLVLAKLKPHASRIEHAFLFAGINTAVNYWHWRSFVWPSFFCNLFAIPLMSYCLLPLCLTAWLCSYVSAPLCHWLLSLCILILDYTLKTCAKSSEIIYRFVNYAAMLFASESH